MIRLSDRLQRIADDINAGETMADIGTDHGFLPVILAESGKCHRVIMADISALSLDKARETAAQRGFCEGSSEEASRILDFRVGDGLSILKPAEVDVVVIAGMGGKLIRDIMATDLALTCSFRKFVLQPRIGQGNLRKWLADNGFVIIREGVVYEGRHIPEIITVLSPGERMAEPESQIEDLMKRAERAMPEMSGEMHSSEVDDVRWRIPPWMIYADGPVDAFLIRNIAAEEEKLENVRRARKRDMELEQKILHNIEYLKHLQALRKEENDGRE